MVKHSLSLVILLSKHRSLLEFGDDDIDDGMEEFGVEVVGPLPLAHVSEGSELVAQAGEFFLGCDLDGEQNMQRYCLNDGVFFFAMRLS